MSDRDDIRAGRGPLTPDTFKFGLPRREKQHVSTESLNRQIEELQRRVAETESKMKELRRFDQSVDSSKAHRDELDWVNKYGPDFLKRCAAFVLSKLLAYKLPEEAWERLADNEIRVSTGKAAEIHRVVVAAVKAEYSLADDDARKAVEVVCPALKTVTQRAGEGYTGATARLVVGPREVPRQYDDGGGDNIVKLQCELIAGGNISLGQFAAVRALVEKEGIESARKVFAQCCVLEPGAAHRQLQVLTDKLAATEGLPRVEASFRAMERYPALARQAFKAKSFDDAPARRDMNGEQQAAANKAANDAYEQLRALAAPLAEQKLRDYPDSYKTKAAAMSSAMEDVWRRHPALAKEAFGEDRWLR